jgi:hypothetical protein
MIDIEHVAHSQLVFTVTADVSRRAYFKITPITIIGAKHVYSFLLERHAFVGSYSLATCHWIMSAHHQVMCEQAVGWDFRVAA